VVIVDGSPVDVVLAMSKACAKEEAIKGPQKAANLMNDNILGVERCENEIVCRKNVFVARIE